MDADILHIYGQEHEHQEAYIVGNREALETLRAAIDRALTHEDGLAMSEQFTSDGEGYEVFVVRRDDPWEPGSVWYELHSPYALYDLGANAKIHPFTLLGCPPAGPEIKALIERLREEGEHAGSRD